MKRTQLIDACRNVRKELVAFLSIVVIGMLAAVAYLSIAYAAATLEKDANIFFNGSGLWDPAPCPASGRRRRSCRPAPSFASAEA